MFLWHDGTSNLDMRNITETISGFANQWLGMALPKLFLLFLGILLCILVVTAVWDRRIKPMGASFGIGLSALLFVISLGGNITGLIGSLDIAMQIRLMTVLVSIAMLFLTIVSFARTELHLRYAVLWLIISLLVLLTALFPGPLKIFPNILGIHYGTSVAFLVIVFLLLLSFHLCSMVSSLQDREKELGERIRLLEQNVLGETAHSSNDVPTTQNFYEALVDRLLSWDIRHFFSQRRIRYGTSLTAPAIILLTLCAVIFTGMLAPRVMIGDEVTHYYMMQTQSKNLLAPNFKAEIPTGWGETEVRRYPHSFLWHYFAAVLFYVSGGSFFIIQLYQAFFLAQLLGIAYLLARTRRGVETRSALVYLLLLASLPMTLIFSVAFYQDVPMTAQVLTAFYLLQKNRWFSASIFLCLALGIKVTAILFFPAFFVCLCVWTYRRSSWKKALLIMCCSLILVSSFTFAFSRILKIYGEATFYPILKMEQIVSHHFTLYIFVRVTLFYRSLFGTCR